MSDTESNCEKREKDVPEEESAEDSPVEKPRHRAEADVSINEAKKKKKKKKSKKKKEHKDETEVVEEEEKSEIEAKEKEVGREDKCTSEEIQVKDDLEVKKVNEEKEEEEEEEEEVVERLEKKKKKKKHSKKDVKDVKDVNDVNDVKDVKDVKIESESEKLPEPKNTLEVKVESDPKKKGEEKEDASPVTVKKVSKKKSSHKGSKLNPDVEAAPEKPVTDVKDTMIWIIKNQDKDLTNVMLTSKINK